jgi:hypothetical protein
MLALVIEVAGNLRGWGLGHLIGAPASAAAGAALLAIAAGWLWPGRGRRAEGSVAGWLVRSICFLPAAAFAASLVGNPFVRSHPWSVAGWVGFASVALILVALPLLRGPPAAVAAVAVLAGITLRAVTFQASQLEMGGDMIPLAHQAAGRLLRGESPYGEYLLPWRVPLTYLPITWLAYVPSRQLGFHPRWVGAAAELVVLGAVTLVAAGGRPWRAALYHPALPFAAAVYLLPTSIEWARIATAPVGWAALACALGAVVLAARADAVFWGLAAAATPLTAVFLPFVGLAWWRALGLRGLLAKAALMLAVLGAVILPFYLWAPKPFLYGTVRWFNDLDLFPRLKWRAGGDWVNHAGLSGLFWLSGLERWLKPLQALLVAFVALLYGRRGARRQELPAFGAAAFLAFMVFNPVIWPYFHQPALVAALLALAAMSPGSPPDRISFTAKVKV